eukprot:TRINITY_DN9872_c0_g1_i1.p1 TRINITY_DN9872_c0_g1~~TRINITY_DN9872_c0_g1_i1.p1  ORF type:complete len:582 (+),score=69.84 TRINITY_DN9872_c0_g1_i1:187-1932(+)
MLSDGESDGKGKSTSLLNAGEWAMEESVVLNSEEGGTPELNPLSIDPPTPTKTSEKAKDLIHDGARSKRPANEVYDTVEYMLDLGGCMKKEKSRINKLICTLTEDMCPVEELSIFFTYLQALLTTLLSPVASFAENKEMDDESPIVTMIGNHIMRDIVDASRASLKSYHKASSGKRLGIKKGSFLRRKSTPAASLNRRLSCHSLMLHDTTSCDVVVKSFGTAFTGGDDAPHKAVDKRKQRPASRIDRAGSATPTPLPSYDTTPPSAPVHPPKRNNLQRKASMQVEGRIKYPPFDDLFSMKYFDIIIETVCVVLCVKYEHQLMELSTEGEDSGVRRAAEWITARFLDEFYNDGIDPQQALCEQLVLCAEGLAIEDGSYVWRRCGNVDQNVIAVVWGEAPEDVLAGVLKSKDEGHTWYEWGMFAQPGVRTPDGRLFTSPRLNPLQYRYRLAPACIASSLELRNTNTAPLRAPSFLLTRPGATMAAPNGGTFEGITLSEPPEGSEHKGGNLGRPKSTRHKQPRVVVEEPPLSPDDSYCDTDLYAWSFEEALRQQRENEGNDGYNQLESSQNSSKGKCLPCCAVA